MQLINRVPKQVFDVDGQRKRVRKAQEQAAGGIQADLEAVTATWKHKPKIEVRISEGQADVIIKDRIFNYLNEGTRGGYLIFPKRKKRLAFGVPFRSKTQPGSLMSGPGSRGSTTIVRPYVQHPGIKARRFTKTALDKWEKIFLADIRAAVR